ncbi:MAG TPA: hypothetical protein VGX91_14735 [Candidatus Cybelea sp.]|nr:hypothetical protein [Candidatus Cybelea sp.]
MRVALYATAACCVAVLLRPDSLAAALATAASALIEAVPFVVAGIVAARVLRRPQLAAYVGCGCAAGPSARSLPAAVAAALVFGAPVALARLAAAVLAAALLRRRDACAAPPGLLGDLRALVAPSLLAGATMQLGGALELARLPHVAQALAGAALGFAAAPCALGAVPLAGALHARAPLAAAAFLGVAGIADLRALSRRHPHASEHDALGYVVLAVALAVVAARRGDALVHPALTPALGVCAAVAAACAFAKRQARAPAQRAAPLLMLAGALIAAPPPQYRATETTLTGLFPGESVRFTGVLARDGARSAIVRYAITCCRADASPIAVQLTRAPQAPAGTWLQVEGRIESDGGTPRLDAASARRIAPPTDPFVYR